MSAPLLLFGGVGAVVLAFVVAITAGLIERTPGEEPGPLAQPTSTASAVASPTSPTTPEASGTPDHTVAPTPAPPPPATSPPSPEPAQPVAVDGIAMSLVDRLNVRAAPGVSAGRLGTIMAGWDAYVADGPVYADGVPWYLISGLGLPPNSGCELPYLTDPFNCPGWIGWAAGASPEGEPWLVGTEPRCPDPSNSRAVATLQPLVRLACFRETSLQFTAWWTNPTTSGGCDLDAGPEIEWLLCPYATSGAPTQVGLDSLVVALDPGSGVAMPSGPTWLTVTGHLDDPAAAACALVPPNPLTSEMMGAELAGEAQVLRCRETFVADSVIATAQP